MLGVIFFLFSLFAFSADLTQDYEDLYTQESVLQKEDLAQLKDTEIVLIPGIASEAFIWSDHRGILDFSFLFKDYLGAQRRHYQNLNLVTSRLFASSADVSETIAEIEDKLKSIEAAGKKVIFISHSLGGLALLDFLFEKGDADISAVQGIVFLQSPFYGSPVASIYFQNPYYLRNILGPIMPWVNTSEASVRYLTLENRHQLMTEHANHLTRLIQKIPMITAGGTSLEYRSIFRPSINLIGHGCLSYIRGKCRSRILFEGPYDDSDGMVPFENSKLPGVDHVKLVGVDHGKTVLAMPFKNVDRVKMTDVLLKLLLRKF